MAMIVVLLQPFASNVESACACLSMVSLSLCLNFVVDGPLSFLHCLASFFLLICFALPLLGEHCSALGLGILPEVAAHSIIAGLRALRRLIASSRGSPVCALQGCERLWLCAKI